MNVNFLMMPYKNVYNDILGRSFLPTFNAVASPIHLNIKYRNSVVKMIVILVNMHHAHLIHEVVLKNSIVTGATFERQRKKTHQTVSTIDLRVREDYTP